MKSENNSWREEQVAIENAYTGLPSEVQKLLSQLAVIPGSMTWELAAAMNPFAPELPPFVSEPEDPEVVIDEWKDLTDDEQAEIQGAYQEALTDYQRYCRETQSILESEQYRQGAERLASAMAQLQQCSLLHYIRDQNQVEMLPDVREYATSRLSPEDRIEAFDRALSHLGCLPPDDFQSATELADIALSLQIYQCLIGAGRFEEAADFFHSGLSTTLEFHLGGYETTIALLTPLFGDPREELPKLESFFNQGSILTCLGNAYFSLEKNEEACEIYQRTLGLTVTHEEWEFAAILLENLHEALVKLARRAEAAAALSLAGNLAQIVHDRTRVAMCLYYQLGDAIDQGQFSTVEAFLTEFRRLPVPPVECYRPGDIEFAICRSQFYQGTLSVARWHAGYDIAIENRNVLMEHNYLALKAEWELSNDRAQPALNAIDEALKITKRLGVRRADYHDLRA